MMVRLDCKVKGLLGFGKEKITSWEEWLTQSYDLLEMRQYVAKANS